MVKNSKSLDDFVGEEEVNEFEERSVETEVGEYKDTPIGKIPSEWNIVKLHEVAEIRGNKSVNKFEEVAFIPMEFIPDSGIFAKFERRKKKDVKSFIYCESGDLLLAKITPSLENGKQGIVPDDVPNGFALATTEVFPILCKNIDKLFLFYILKFTKFRHKIIASMIGTTGRQRASKVSVQNLQVPLPPLSEQQKIAEILSIVDNAIQKVDNAIARTERLKKGLMQELLTKGIGHEEFKDTGIGRIPKKWDVVNLEEILEDIRYGTSKKSNNGKQGYPVVGIPNILHGKIDEDNLKYVVLPDKEKQNLTLNEGDILLVRTNANPDYIGRCALFKNLRGTWVYASYLIRIRIDKDRADPGYLVKLLQSEKARRQFLSIARTSAGNYNINTTGIKSIVVCLPEISEQQKIAEILSTVDKKLELERKRKQKLERIKKGLMNDLLTGRRRVRTKRVVGDNK